MFGLSSTGGRSRAAALFQLGIRQKVALSLLTTLLIALSISGWLALLTQRHDILRETQLRGAQLARFAAQSLTNAVVSHDYDGLEQWAQQVIARRDDIAYLRVISRKGHTMAEAGTQPGSGARMALFVHDIGFDGETIGKLVVGLSTDRIAATLQHRKTSLIRSEFLVVLFIVFGEFFALSYIIIRPITRFSRAMKAAPAWDGRESLDGIKARRPREWLHKDMLPVQNHDELGELARTFVRLQERTTTVVQELRRSEKKNRALVEAIPDMMLRLRHDGLCLDCKIPRDCSVTIDPRQLVGNHVATALPGHMAGALLHHLNQAIHTRHPQIFQHVEECNGTLHSFEARVTPATDDEALVLVRDMTEHKDMKEKIHFLAHFDSLTHLPNRLLFKERLRTAIKRTGRERALAVLVMDLDDFKVINDTLGHDAGDVLLQGVAERLQRCLRVTDYVGRSKTEADVTLSRGGGDEFSLLLTELTDITQASTVARRVLESFKTPFRLNGQDIGVGASIGIAVYPNDGEDAETLIKNADTALHHAKEQARNHFYFYAPAMNSTLSRRLVLENHLRTAIERDELRLHYQPQISVSTGQIVGVEALLRWSSPTLGEVSPAEFIPIAEDTGLIAPIGAWVLRAACVQNRRWQEMGLPPLRVAVNVSGVQFRQGGLADQVRETLRETGMPGWCLELEVTEGVLLRNDEQVIRTLAELKKMGVHLSLDDFGTGYSSLSYLKRFPLDTLKIDRSFVRDIGADADGTELACAIIAIAHSLKLQVVAEGVETEDQFSFLRNQRCDLMQGFLFSPAMAASGIVEVLRQPMFARAATA